MWIASAESPLGPFDINGAHEVNDPERYAGTFTDDDREAGETKSMSFRNETGASFVGEIKDPYIVDWLGNRLLVEAH